MSAGLWIGVHPRAKSFCFLVDCFNGGGVTVTNTNVLEYSQLDFTVRIRVDLS